MKTSVGWTVPWELRQRVMRKKACHEEETVDRFRLPLLPGV